MDTTEYTRWAGDLSPNAPDIAHATANLFIEIAKTSSDPKLAAGMLALNARMIPIRQFEAVFFPDLEQEYAALSACWKQRDMVHLQQLVTDYFERRRVIVPALAALMNARH